MRADAHKQYLKPAAGRQNLTVLTNAKALKIELERGPHGPVAQGVTFSVKGPDGSKHTGMPQCMGTATMSSSYKDTCRSQEFATQKS